MNMFNRKTKKAKREEGEKYQSIKVRLLNLIGERSDVNRLMAADILGIGINTLDGAMVSLRKAGIRVFPVNGPGTPLRIVTTQRDAERYMDWTDRLHLGTTKRMIATAAEFGEQYRELSDRPMKLLKTLNSATSERPLLS